MPASSQGAENVLHGLPSILDGLVVGQGVIAEGAEYLRRFQQLASGVAHIAQGHYVALRRARTAPSGG